MNDQQNDRLGPPPWRLQDLRSFTQLCKDALRLASPEKNAESPGITLQRLASPYRNLAALETALHAHPVYRWLRDHVPAAVDATNDATPYVQFRQAPIVAWHVLGARRFQNKSESASLAKRRRKQRQAALKALKRVQASIADGVIFNPDLEEQITNEIRLVGERHRSIFKLSHPWLWYLALALCREFGAADPQLLIQAGTWADPDFQERTGYRYAKDAQAAVRKGARAHASRGGCNPTDR
jgi:hypothetical protein